MSELQHELQQNPEGYMDTEIFWLLRWIRYRVLRVIVLVGALGQAFGSTKPGKPECRLHSSETSEISQVLGKTGVVLHLETHINYKKEKRGIIVD